jgi:ribosomal RNA-processing protein 36
MAISDLLKRRVRARPDEEEEVYSDASVSASEVQSDEEQLDESDLEDANEGSVDENDDESNPSGVESESEEGDPESEDDHNDDHDDDVQSSINNISFGALAKAQASFGSKSKQRNKLLKENEAKASSSPLDDIRARIQEAREQKRKASSLSVSKEATTRFEKPASRSSKHAPMVQSSKYAVSRKRTIVEPPSAPKTRDPRFDPTIVGRRGGASGPSDAYAFLDDYRAAELKDLKEQLAKTKDVKGREALQREIRSTTDRLRAIENNKREREIVSEHNKREKQLIREGKKSTPYFLKHSEIKKQAMLKKYEGMKSRDRVKALERRRKKATAKERKEMPMERRGMGERFDSRKRRRLD